MTKRERLHPEIKRLREVEGLKWREIGERVGLSIQRAFDYYKDPDGSGDRARKARHAERHAADWACPECGAPMPQRSMRAGYERCAACRDARWAATRQRMIAMRRRGMTNVAIAAELGLSMPAVANAICRERKRDPSIPPSPHYIAHRVPSDGSDKIYGSTLIGPSGAPTPPGRGPEPSGGPEHG